MKLDHFEKIASHIKHDVPCPNCKNITTNNLVEVISTRQNEAEFHVKCTFCGADIRVLAQLAGQMPVGAFPQRLKQTKFFSPDLAQKISESVKNFRGQDVKELFKK